MSIDPVTGGETLWLDRPLRKRVTPLGPPTIERIDPCEGACGVFRDVVILVRFSWPIDPESVTVGSVRVEAPDGPVPGEVALSPDGTMVFWRGRRLLDPERTHVIVADGLRDRQGRTAERFNSRFVTSELTLDDLAT